MSKNPFADVGKLWLYHTHKAFALLGSERWTHALLTVVL